MELWTADDKAIINANFVTAKTYAEKVGKVGYGNYVKSLGGIFARCFNQTAPITTVQELHDRAAYVCGLMSIFRFCYWNGKTWWYWMNSASKAFYTSKQTKSCREGTIGQLCQGLDGRTRITCCNYGVSTLLKQCGIYSLKKTTVSDKSKLQPGDVIDFYRKSDGKWHHQVIVHSISGGKIWCVDFGSKFIKTGVPLHYMSLTGTTAGGEYGTDKWKGRHRITLKKEQEVIPTLNGIDIASYQAGIDLGKVPCDFVIIKATQGTSYVNPDCNRAYASAKAAGKKIGLYHYASGENAVAEADYFLKNIENYIGSAVLALDWESAQNSAFGKTDVSYCKVFLDRVYAKTGVRPLIYMSQSVCLAHDWKAIASDYGLWVARYPNNDPTGYRDTKDYGNVGAWKNAAIYQYTSHGRLSNWNGNLDLDIAYMSSTAWDKYAKGSKQEDVEMPGTVKKGAKGTDVYVIQSICRTYYVKVNGKSVKRTLKLDGDFGEKTHVAVTYWQGKHQLTQDGVVGPKTWKAMWESL